jgi:hypothetical protein
MAKFNFEIKETLSRIIEVEAKSKDNAIELLREKYLNEEIVLDSDDFTDVEIRALI